MLYLHNGSKKILEGVYIEAGSIGADNHKEKVRKAEGVLEISKNPQQAIKVWICSCLWLILTKCCC